MRENGSEGFVGGTGVHDVMDERDELTAEVEADGVGYEPTDLNGDVGDD